MKGAHIYKAGANALCLSISVSEKIISKFWMNILKIIFYSA